MLEGLLRQALIFYVVQLKSKDMITCETLGEAVDINLSYIIVHLQMAWADKHGFLPPPFIVSVMFQNYCKWN